MVVRWQRAVGTLAFAFVGILCMGVVCERVGERQDRNHLPQVGKSFDIGGRSLNLFCSGGGSPTVIFESNGGVPGFRWVRLQRQVAAFTRACWYDRAGLGWSDPGPFPNHSESVAHDLHALLASAHEAPPYILVGHAMGGFHVRVYRSFFPEQVAGLVLVDPMNEDMTVHIHNHNEFFRPTVLLLLRAISGVGFLRLTQPRMGPPPAGWSSQEWSTLHGLSRRRDARIAAAQELPIWVNGELARAGACYDSLPMVVLSAGLQDQEEDPKLDHDHVLKLQLHDRLAHRSARGKHVVVSNSGHDIPDLAPEAVITAIQDIVHAVRSTMKTSSGVATETP